MSSSVKPRPFLNVSNDDKAIGERRRFLFGDNIFGVKPDLKPLQPCTYGDCQCAYNPNTKLWGAGCKGYCSGC